MFDRGDGVWYGDRGQSSATRESRLTDGGDGVGNSDRGQSAAPIENRLADRGDGVGDGDRGQSSATRESRLADRGDGVGDGDRGQSAATRESRLADGGDGVRNADGNKLILFVKSTGFNSDYCVRNDDNCICTYISFQPCLCSIGIYKTIFDNIVYVQCSPRGSRGYARIVNVADIIESFFSDGGDRIGYSNRGQNRAIIESILIYC